VGLVRRTVVRLMVSLGGAALMLAGGLMLAARPSIPLGPDGFAFVGYADGAAGIPLAMPVTLLVAGFVLLLGLAVAELVLDLRRR
jgi:hypothetical protein